MQQKRSAFQGVKQVILFNWHFYAIAVTSMVLSLLMILFMPAGWHRMIYFLLFVISWFTLISMITAWYVYDYSGIYSEKWMVTQLRKDASHVLNVHAGLDEFSSLIKKVLPQSDLNVIDILVENTSASFSIREARKWQNGNSHCEPADPSSLPFNDRSFDQILLLFAAHEIREELTRVKFFRELLRVLKPGGSITLLEHPRDVWTFLSFGPGFLHFFSSNSWRRDIEQAGGRVVMRKLNKFTLHLSIYLDGKAC